MIKPFCKYSGPAKGITANQPYSIACNGILLTTAYCEPICLSCCNWMAKEIRGCLLIKLNNNHIFQEKFYGKMHVLFPGEPWLQSLFSQQVASQSLLPLVLDVVMRFDLIHKTKTTAKICQATLLCHPCSCQCPFLPQICCSHSWDNLSFLQVVSKKCFCFLKLPQ